MTNTLPERAVRLLMFVPERYPTFRADVATLFGKYLPRYGVIGDLIAEASTTNSAEASKCEWNGGNLLLCPPSTGRLKRHLALTRFVIMQLMKCRRGRYDAIQVRDAVVPALIGLWVARREGVRFFYWMSYPMYESHIERMRTHGLSMGLARYIGAAVRGHVGKWLLYRRVLPACDHVFVQSAKMLQDVAREGVPEAKMTPVPMGVDVEDIIASHIEPIQDARFGGRRVMTYLGTLARVRRIDFLFEVLAQVKSVFPSVVLVLAGDATEPSDRAWLQERARETGVAGDVIWAGWVPREEGWRIVCASDVALSPFPPSFELNSCSPTKAIEYLALGVPIVCNDQPDQARVVSESRAGLCVPYSVSAFSSAIVDLLQDPLKASRMGARGPSYVAAHRSYETIARELAEAYQRLLPACRT